MFNFCNMNILYTYKVHIWMNMWDSCKMDSFFMRLSTIYTLMNILYYLRIIDISLRTITCIHKIEILWGCYFENIQLNWYYKNTFVEKILFEYSKVVPIRHLRKFKEMDSHSLKTWLSCLSISLKRVGGLVPR